MPDGKQMTAVASSSRTHTTPLADKTFAPTPFRSLACQRIPTAIHQRTQTHLVVKVVEEVGLGVEFAVHLLSHRVEIPHHVGDFGQVLVLLQIWGGQGRV